MNESPLKIKSFQLAVEVVLFYKFLINEKKEFVLSKQILKSGTSVGAQIRESTNAESKADFIHKLGIAQKECDETLYWLELLCETGYATPKQAESLKTLAEELLKMLRSSILTVKGKPKNRL